MNEKANARTGSERELSDLAALRPAGRFSGGKRVGLPWSFAQTKLFDRLFFLSFLLNSPTCKCSDRVSKADFA